MVMRTVFDPIKASPKLNLTHANKPIPLNTISWELFLMASSLLTNQSYLFQDGSASSAKQLLLNYMDTIMSAGNIRIRICDTLSLFTILFLASLWNDVDPWISARFSKTCELVARLAAQLAHIDMTMSLLQAFIHARFPPSGGFITINGKFRIEGDIVNDSCRLICWQSLASCTVSR